MFQKTYVAKNEENGTEWNRDWYLIDAEDQTLGRLASQIAHRLMGKHKPIYTKHVDVGDYIVVVNAEKVHVSGNKRQDKMYYHYSGYPSGLRERNYADQIHRHPTSPLQDAVRRMLPRTTLGRRMFRKLKVYAGPEHPHEGQNPTPIDLVK
jgi:large subunit ribosomal protein L13